MHEGFLPVLGGPRGGPRLYYRSHTDGDALVIVPAAAWLADDFGPLLPGRTVVFYDQRNRGRSDIVEHDALLGIDFDVQDAEAMRRHVGAERVSLVGWSYLGGMVARYALSYPEHVERIVLVGPVPPRRDPYQAQAREADSRRIDPEGAARVRELAKDGLLAIDPHGFCRASMRVTLPARMADAQAIAGMKSDPCACRNECPDQVARQITGIFTSLGDWDWRDELRSLRVPTLVIHGDNDTIPIEAAREWVSVLPDASLLEVEGAGHLPWLEHPEIVFPAIDAFLSVPAPDVTSTP